MRGSALDITLHRDRHVQLDLSAVRNPLFSKYGQASRWKFGLTITDRALVFNFYVRQQDVQSSRSAGADINMGSVDFGAIAAGVLQVMVFLAIFSCVLANMVVATRLTFAMSRDKMLPGSSVLGAAGARDGTAPVSRAATRCDGVSLGKASRSNADSPLPPGLAAGATGFAGAGGGPAPTTGHG